MRGLNTFKLTNYINCLKNGLKTTHNIRSIVVSMSCPGKYVQRSFGSIQYSLIEDNIDFYKKNYSISFGKYETMIKYINNMEHNKLEEYRYTDLNKLKKYYKKQGKNKDNSTSIDKYNYVPFKFNCLCGKNMPHKKLLSHYENDCKISGFVKIIAENISNYIYRIETYNKRVAHIKTLDFSEPTMENLEKLKHERRLLIRDYSDLSSAISSFENHNIQGTKKQLNTAIATFKRYSKYELIVRDYDYELFKDILKDAFLLFAKTQSKILYGMDLQLQFLKENVNHFTKDTDCNICLEQKKCREVICCTKPICEDCEKGIKQTHTQSQNCPYCRNTNW